MTTADIFLVSVLLLKSEMYSTTQRYDMLLPHDRNTRPQNKTRILNRPLPSNPRTSGQSMQSSNLHRTIPSSLEAAYRKLVPSQINLDVALYSTANFGYVNLYVLRAPGGLEPC
jgi:hypothetical protein